MDAKITIKTAQSQQDIAVVETLAEEIWVQHYLPIIGQAQIGYMLGKFQSKRAIAKAVEDGHTYYIAYLHSVPCGYCAITQEHGIFLSKFYVLQSQRGKGIGKAMMAAIFAYAKKHNAQRIWLTCNKHNSDTLAIYAKLGFAKIDEVVTDIGGGFVMDDYVLEKRLDGKRRKTT